MAKILVVEDEREIRELIKLHLEREDHRVFEAESVEEAREKYAADLFDLAVIDWMLPGLSGLELAKAIHGDTRVRTGMLMVTARTEPNDVIEALEAGVDDYLTKPFVPGVLIARVRALLRRTTARTSPEAPANLLRVGSLEVDVVRCEVRANGEPLSLTLSELKILVFLMKNTGRVFTREMLITEVQGADVTVVGRSIDTHIFGLRKKLGAAGDLVETVRGIGYRVKSLAGLP